MPDRTHSRDFETRDRVQTKPHVWLTVALPRTGKTTWANAYRGAFDATIVSTDDIRRAMSVEFDAKLEGRVWGTFNLMVKALLARGQNLIIDNPNHTIAARKQFVKMATEGKIFLTFVLLPQLAESEHRARCAKVEFPWEVVEEHRAKWQPVTEAELSTGDCIRL